MKQGPFVDIVAGARPNFMKAGPIYQAIHNGGELNVRFVYSGQHTNPIMCSLIYKEVGLPSRPDVILGSNLRPGFDYLGEMMSAYNAEFRLGAERPLACIVLGDTDTALAAAVVAARNEIPVVHVEAGVRSHDHYSPEEINRIMIDSISDLLLTPFQEATDEVKDKVRGQTYTVGNVMIDALRKVQLLPEWEELSVPYEFDVLVTLHRQSNVNDNVTLRKIMRALDELNQNHKLLFPTHPRTHSKLGGLGIHRDYIVQPMEYSMFLKALIKAKAVITDSGGVQAEAASMGTPCFVLRETTGWTNLQRMNLVTLINVDNMSHLVGDACDNGKRKVRSLIPEWDGYSAGQIAQYVQKFVHATPRFKQGDY